MKKYVLEITQDETGLHMSSECHGFFGHELVGLLDWKKDDILRQLRGEIRPDVIRRNVVKED